MGVGYRNMKRGMDPQDDVDTLRMGAVSRKQSNSWMDDGDCASSCTCLGCIQLRSEREGEG